MIEPYRTVIGKHGSVAIGVCYPPFRPRLLFENLDEAEKTLRKLLAEIAGYKRFRDNQIPQVFRDGMGP